MSTPQDTLEAKSAAVMHSILAPQRKAIQAKWVKMVHGTYPLQTVGFLRTQNDRFANPVGYRTEEAATVLLDALFAQTPDEEALHTAIDALIRVRAVQEFSPEAAVGVIFALKDCVREVLVASGQAPYCLSAILNLESRVDAFALIGFGIYARCREQIYQMKTEEFKRKHSQVLRLAQEKARL